MQCDRCGITIAVNQHTLFQGQKICEDCYIDALTPAKPCDPWAVYTARSLSGKDTIVTRQQRELLDILEETKGIELELLANRLNLKLVDLEREIATLRHMEKIRVVKQDDKKILKTWA